MPKKIPISTMREWLESYEQGKSEASIAREARRDVRTVKKGMEQARREQDMRTARAELLKDALKRHQNDLAETITKLNSALVVPSYNLEFRDEHIDGMAPIPMSGALAKYEAKKEWTISLNAENGPVYELLQEHLKHDPVWKIINQWKKLVETHLAARTALRLKTKLLLEKKTGLKVLKGKEQAAQAGHLDPLCVNLLFDVMLKRLLGVPEGTDPEGRIMSTSEGYIQHGQGGSILAYCPQSAEKCRNAILEAFEEVQQSSEAIAVSDTYKELGELTARARRALDEVSLLRMVPGNCRVCHRLGM